MKVREIINDAVERIGAADVGIDNQAGKKFQTCLRQLKFLASEMRLAYPFRSTITYSYDQLSSIDYQEIDSVVSTQSIDGSGVKQPMQGVDLSVWNDLTVVKVSGGWPKYYYFEKPSQIKTFPESDGYYFIVTGRANQFENLSADSDITAPMFFISAMTQRLSKLLAPIFKKNWTEVMAMNLASADYNLEANTQNPLNPLKAEDCSNYRIYRVRNMLRV